MKNEYSTQQEGFWAGEFGDSLQVEMRDSRSLPQT
jgi:hypothetical protein